MATSSEIHQLESGAKWLSRVIWHMLRIKEQALSEHIHAIAHEVVISSRTKTQVLLHTNLLLMLREAAPTHQVTIGRSLPADFPLLICMVAKLLMVQVTYSIAGPATSPVACVN